MRIQRKIGLAIMLVSIFTLLSSYLFTIPDKEAQLLQQKYFSRAAVYSPKISELVITDYYWTTDMEWIATVDELVKAELDELIAKAELDGSKAELEKVFGYTGNNYNPTFYGFVIRYNYLATICLFLFSIGLYMFAISQNDEQP